ncbi:hypothetical protein SARC_17301, partial [Sphaeroforma arctica JP610]
KSSLDVRVHSNFFSPTHSAPGRCVPQLITTLKSLVPSDHYKKLVRYQKFILKLATAQKAGDVEAIQIAEDELAQSP